MDASPADDGDQSNQPGSPARPNKKKGGIGKKGDGAQGAEQTIQGGATAGKDPWWCQVRYVHYDFDSKNEPLGYPKSP